MKINKPPSINTKKLVPSRTMDRLHHLGMGLAWAGFLGMTGASAIMCLALAVPVVGISLPVTLPVAGVVILSAGIAAVSSTIGAVLAATTYREQNTLPRLKAHYIQQAGAVGMAAIGLGITGYQVSDVDGCLKNKEASCQALIPKGFLTKQFAATPRTKGEEPLLILSSPIQPSLAPR